VIIKTKDPGASAEALSRPGIPSPGNSNNFFGGFCQRKGLFNFQEKRDVFLKNYPSKTIQSTANKARYKIHGYNRMQDERLSRTTGTMAACTFRR